jgi:hypothetical protein
MTGQKIIGRFTVAPIGLFRIQTGQSVKLREYYRQKELKRMSFDYRSTDGIIKPATGSDFIGPNGMSLRPGGFVLGEIIANYRGNNIYFIPKGTKFPSELVLLHEHSDHYSLQTSVECHENTLNQRLTDFLANMEQLSKEKYFERHPMF